MKLVPYIIILITGLFSSCVKDKPVEAVNVPINIGSGQKVYITNEGNFNGGNASVTLYSDGAVISDIYKSQNNNAPLGDVCQSMVKANSSYYLVVNNSGKVVVVSSTDFKQKAVIAGLSSPRYLLPVTFQKAYVSDYNANAISIIDLTTNSKVGTISCNGWTEQMAIIYNKAFVTNMQKNYTYVINTINDQVTDSINTGFANNSVVTDKNSRVWILSGGDNANNIPGRLSKINPVTLQVEQSYIFNPGDSPGHLCINAGRDTLYFLNTNIYRMPISATSLPSSAFINSSGANFYSLGVSEKDHSVFVSDALDYVQNSNIMVFSANGSFVKSFKAGIITSGFYFD